MSRSLVIAAGLIAAASLSACGKMGQLERPGPLFGRAAAPSTEGDAPADNPETVRTIDPRDRASVQPNLPPRTDPIPNTRDPSGKAPQGSLPDPFHYPE